MASGRRVDLCTTSSHRKHVGVNLGAYHSISLKADARAATGGYRGNHESAGEAGVGADARDRRRPPEALDALIALGLFAGAVISGAAEADDRMVDSTVFVLIGVGVVPSVMRRRARWRCWCSRRCHRAARRPSPRRPSPRRAAHQRGTGRGVGHQPHGVDRDPAHLGSDARIRRQLSPGPRPARRGRSGRGTHRGRAPGRGAQRRDPARRAVSARDDRVPPHPGGPDERGQARGKDARHRDHSVRAWRSPY